MLCIKCIHPIYAVTVRDMSEILQTFNREKPGDEFITIIHRLRMFGIFEQLSEIIVFPKNLEELSSDY